MSTQVPGWMVINATRYALGRMTYVVADTCEYLIHSLHQHREETREIVLRDIREDIERAERRGETVGMAMDHAEWKKVLAHFESTAREEDRQPFGQSHEEEHP